MKYVMNANKTEDKREM